MSETFDVCTETKELKTAFGNIFYEYDDGDLRFNFMDSNGDYLDYISVSDEEDYIAVKDYIENKLSAGLVTLKEFLDRIGYRCETIFTSFKELYDYAKANGYIDEGELTKSEYFNRIGDSYLIWHP